MGELFWDDEFDWVEPQTQEPDNETPDFDRKDPNQRRTRKFIIGVAAAMAAVVTVAVVQSERGGPSRIQKLTSQFEAKDYASYAVPKFNFLVNLSPAQVNEGVIRNRKEFGQEIQDAAVTVSLAAFRQGLDNRGQAVDMYDIATQLIPQETQDTLAEDGVEFIGESPVRCDIVYGTGNPPYNPLDYSNHPPADFKIRSVVDGGHETTLVPLGTEDMPTTADPIQEFNPYDPFPLHITPPALPCVDMYPHPVYGPNGATYPEDSDFVVELW